MKEGIIEIGKKLVTTGLTSGTGGNISFYDRAEDLVWITPSGIDYFELTQADLVGVTLNGEVVQGDKKPSSEWMIHTEIYKRRPDVNSVIHAHTVFSTVLAILREPLPASHYMIGVSGKEVPVAPYATFGSEELAIGTAETLADNNAALLANHGIVTAGKSLQGAFHTLDQIEYCSKLYIYAKSVGQPYILDDAEMTRVLQKFEGYGQQK